MEKQTCDTYQSDSKILANAAWIDLLVCYLILSQVTSWNGFRELLRFKVNKEVLVLNPSRN